MNSMDELLEAARSARERLAEDGCDCNAARGVDPPCALCQLTAALLNANEGVKVVRKKTAKRPTKDELVRELCAQRDRGLRWEGEARRLAQVVASLRAERDRIRRDL